MREVSEGVQEDFAFAEMKVVALPDLYAGKIAAALDRQHPRDLFDIKYLYENDGITNDIFQAFLVYLISHDRQPHELLDPRRKDIARDYEKHFVGMTREPVPLSDLLDARERLIEDIVTMARHSAARQFLHSFFALEPDYSLLGLEADVAALPAVRWKILNLERLRREQRGKFDDQFARLDAVLRS